MFLCVHTPLNQLLAMEYRFLPLVWPKRELKRPEVPVIPAPGPPPRNACVMFRLILFRPWRVEGPGGLAERL